MESRQPMGLAWPSDELHTCFIGRAPAFLVIAPETSCNDIVPAFLSTESHRHHVVESEVFGRKFLPAVLARVVISRIDIRARKLDAVVILHPDVFQQTNDGGEF